MELVELPAITEDDPLAVAAEGADLQPGHWPEVTRRTSESEMRAEVGNAHPMREYFIDNGLAKYHEGLSDEFLQSLKPG